MQVATQIHRIKSDKGMKALTDSKIRRSSSKQTAPFHREREREKKEKKTTIKEA